MANLVSMKEAADVYGVHYRTIVKKARQGQIRSYVVGRVRRIDLDELKDDLKDH